MIKYIVCVPQKWDEERVVAIPYAITAESPLQAARNVFQEHENLKKYCIGEITVLEAKAGRLGNWHNFYPLDKVVPCPK